MINVFTGTGNLTGGVVVLLDLDVVLIQRDKLTAVTADGQAGVRLHESVDGDGTLTACCDGIDGKLGAGVHIAANENIGLGGLISKGICHSPVSAAQFHLRASQQVTPLDALTDGQEHPVTRNGFGVIFVIGRSKAAFRIPNAGATLEYDAGDLSILGQNLLGTPTAVDGYILFQRFCNFFFGGRHLVTRL